jgi:hypothetical protein
MMTPRPSDAWRREHRGPAALAAAYWTAGWDGMCAVVFGIAMVTIYWLPLSGSAVRYSLISI